MEHIEQTCRVFNSEQIVCIWSIRILKFWTYKKSKAKQVKAPCMDEFYDRDENNYIIPPYSNLPILKVKDEIINKARTSRVLIITGDTGSGKGLKMDEF